jgi:hypothetical protein
MSQVVGRKRPVLINTLSPASPDHHLASVEPVDNQNNAGLYVVMFPGTQALKVDGPVAGVTYVGASYPGTATSAASWQIRRVTEVGTDTDIEWATVTPGGGDPDRPATFEHVWDDRAILIYT